MLVAVVVVAVAVMTDATRVITVVTLLRLQQ